MKVSATDERSVVRLAALAQLKIIASSSANMWTKSNVEVCAKGVFLYMWLSSLIYCFG